MRDLCAPVTGLADSAFAGLFGTAKTIVRLLIATPGKVVDWKRSNELVPIALTEPLKSGQPPWAQGVPKPGPTTIDAFAPAPPRQMPSARIAAAIFFIGRAPLVWRDRILPVTVG